MSDSTVTRGFARIENGKMLVEMDFPWDQPSQEQVDLLLKRVLSSINREIVAHLAAMEK